MGPVGFSRSEDWRQRFELVIDEINYVPFEWGTHDCGPSFVGRIVVAMTGKTIPEFDEYRGKYSSAEEAAQLIKDAGYANLCDGIAAYLPEIHPSEAKIGDIVAYEVKNSPVGFALGVVNGERCFVLRPDGLGTKDLLAAKRAFKVG